ncbi:MAG TPA: autotransporter domain-containing protein [Parachlamydiaceae bacterium]|nr:autotransporter domain-containing protein [Parachlamydiaceae bacterium]
MMIRKISTYFICFSSLLSMGLNAVVLTVNSNSDAAFATGGTGVGTTGDLRYALNYINQNPDTYQVVFALGAGSETIALQGMLPILNLNAANNLVIDGGNTFGSGTKIAISGTNTQRGFIAQQGVISIQNMNIQNTVAQGGYGGFASGGGGMGAGGALFINQAQVALSNVDFSNNAAIGGNGAAFSGVSGGGGGMGGDGGSFGISGGGGLGGIGGFDATGTSPAGGGGIAPGGAGGFNGGAGQAGGGIVSAPGGDSVNGIPGGINGGGGGSGTAANNGAGGGGIAGGDGTLITGGDGGYGGGGGGGGGNGGFGGGGGAVGGNGGFGGGGAVDGDGGFGGGGGGSDSIPGIGGVGGGQGALNGGGGGGAGFGGAIFVNSAFGATLIVNGPMTISTSNTVAGSGGGNGTDGAAAGDAIFATAGAPLTFSPPTNTVITINDSIGDDSSNTLPGPGYTPGTSLGEAIVKSENGELQLLGDNTFSGSTTLLGGILTIDSDSSLGKQGVALEVTGVGTLKAAADFDSDRPINLSDTLTFDSGIYDNTLSGAISGVGGLIKRGTGTLTLNGPSDYTGGTLVSVGTLKGDTQSLQGFITNNATLEFDQDFDGIFYGSIDGNGTINKEGSGTTRFIFDSPLFTGKTNVNRGELTLDAVLGGDVFVFDGARFRDNGTVLGNITVQGGLLEGNGRAIGNVTIKNDGTISPGLGTFRVDGFFVQQAGSTYRATFNRAGENSLITVDQTATLLPGARLDLVATNGFKVNTLHTILTADRGLIGEYSNVRVLNDFFTATTLYDTNNVYVFFREEFSRIAEKCNQIQVAAQLEQLGFDISPDAQGILQEFTNLDINETRVALDQMSGEQFTSLALTTELSNRQFTRRIFDPLRILIATNPCAPSVYCTYNQTYDVWSSISGGQSFFQGGRCSSGFNISDFEYTIGVQRQYFRDVTFGAAITFETGNLSYDIGGSGKNCTVLGGVYALYRPKNFYVLGNINLGGSSNRIKRSIDIGNLHFRPKTTIHSYQSSMYAEIGTDFGFNFVLLQPFVALDIGTSQVDKFSDSDSSGNYSFDLSVSGRSFANAATRLGVHLSSAPLKNGWSMALDFSWNYRFSSVSNSVHGSFKNFGDNFQIKGVHLQRNSLEVTVMLNQKINPRWDVFLEGNGFGWNNSFAYSVTAGLLYTW